MKTVFGPRWAEAPAATQSSTTASTSGTVQYGTVPEGPGFWVPPTVVLAGSTQQPVWREEVFGPVVAVLGFEDEAEGRRSQRRLADLRFEAIAFGHGRPIRREASRRLRKKMAPPS